MILSRTLESSSQLPVSVYGTGTHTLNALSLFLEAPSVLRFGRSLRSTPYFRQDVEPLALRHESACIDSTGLLTCSPSKPGLRLLLRPRLTLR